MKIDDCDLAHEVYERHFRGLDGVAVETERRGSVTAARMEILTAQAAAALGKPIGVYETLYFDLDGEEEEDAENVARLAAEKLSRLLPADGPVLAVGLGNGNIVCDSLGKATAERVIATRRFSACFSGLREVSAFSANVAGNTGIESFEVVDGLVSRVRPAALVLVDSLAAGRADRIGRTLQMTDAGLIPGSGAGKRGERMSRERYGIPVVGVGIPMMIRASALSAGKGKGLGDMIVTPREIDSLAARCAFVLAATLNFCFLRGSLDEKRILSLMRGTTA